MTKIKLSAGWDTSDNLVERLIRQFKIDDIDLSNIQFVNDNSYDIIVFFNYVNLNIEPNRRSFVFFHEPTWNGCHQKHFTENITKVFGFDKSLYNVNCEEMLAHTFYGGRGPWIDTLDFWNIENLLNSTFNKTKTISSQITKLNKDNGTTCLYPQRFKIAQLLDSVVYVDSLRGDIKKKDGLIDYKFNFMIENEYHDNWITEKFYDAVLTDTIPIYYGCKNIRQYYPEDGYILLDNVDDLNYIHRVLEDINNNADEIYNQKISALRQIKQKYLKDFNLLRKIINL
jgi:hypothetical protein